MSKFDKKKVEKFLGDCVAGRISVDEQVEFLKNFTPDKLTVEKVLVFAKFMRKNASSKLKMPGCIDICGTGGSGLARINTSTIAAFILADLGVGIAKHGNKAASGRFGSFDLLESLSVDIGKSAVELEKSYIKTGLAFIFARNFHPVMKFFAEARKKIGKPTVFNILGPLLNPANPEMQIIGTSFKKQMRLLAEVSKLLGRKKVMVVRGENGLDEVTLTGVTDVVELKNGRIFEYKIKPEDFWVERCGFEEICGGDGGVNKKIALEILGGESAGRSGDLVFVNVALALKLAGKVKNLKDGYKMAKSALGMRKLEEYKGNILAAIAVGKGLRKSERDFLSALKVRKGLAVIAEVKFASPSKGRIYKGKLNAGEIARLYEGNGASAVSVLTDEKYFQGSFENLAMAEKATEKTPLLCKDFIVHEYQIYKAREFGADAILLIAALLSGEKIQQFIELAESLKMNALVEVHDEEELQKALATSAKIIGINNRNLKTFEIDVGTTNRLAKKIPTGIVVVSESGFNTAGDLKELIPRVNAVLIGTTLMKTLNEGEKKFIKKIHELT